jgi:signal recognition particle receptor subunit beta
MSVINPLSRQLSAKIVYVGPGLSGKTTSLQHIHKRLDPEKRSELVSLATDEDRTLFFDFLPMQVPTVHGLDVRLMLYTVPGQVFYTATRKLVLNGADGIVFVADVQRARLEANIESLASTREDLAAQNIDIDEFPLVFQFNKRDLEGGSTAAELRAALSCGDRAHFDTVATNGIGILETLRAIVKTVVTSLNRSPQVRKCARPFARFDEPTDSGTISEVIMPADDDGEGEPVPAVADAATGDESASEAGVAVTNTHTEHSPREVSHSISPATRRSSVVDGSLATSLFAHDPAGDRSPERVTRVSGLAPDPRESLDPGEQGVDVPKVDGQERITTARPIAGVSFSELWRPAQREPIALIESCIGAGRYHDAVHHVASALALLLRRLPGQPDDSMGTRAALLGLDGREYLHLCRLASKPKETVDIRDALFALYVLVSAQVKNTKPMA